MKRFAKVRGALSYANVTATVALFVALGGSSYAAVKVASKDVRDNSLRSRDIRNNSVTSRDIRNGSLSAKDFKAGAALDVQVINHSSNALQLNILAGVFASTPALHSFLNPGTQQDFSLNPGGAGNVQYWAFNADQERIGSVVLGIVNADKPFITCTASGATLPDGSSTWDGTCSVDGTTATING